MTPEQRKQRLMLLEAWRTAQRANPVLRRGANALAQEAMDDLIRRQTAERAASEALEDFARKHGIEPPGQPVDD